MSYVRTFDNVNIGYASTPTAAGTTTLSYFSEGQQYFTGSTTQTAVLPITNTLILGQSWYFKNLSSGTVTINSSGGNLVYSLAAGDGVLIKCILRSGTSAASWDVQEFGGGAGGAVDSVNGQTGVVVLDADDIDDTATTNKYVTAADITKLGNLSGTNSGDQTSIVGITGTQAQFDTACSDGNFVYQDDLGTGVATFLATPSSTNLASALTDETGSGAAVFADSPTITTPDLVGTSTNDNALAGSVGEFASSSLSAGSSISLTTATVANVTSISLTAGDWDVSWVLAFETASTTSVRDIRGASSVTSATFPGVGNTAHPFAILQFDAFVPGITTFCFGGGMQGRLSLASTTTVYLVARGTFTVSTLKVYGSILARRVR